MERKSALTALVTILLSDNVLVPEVLTGISIDVIIECFTVIKVYFIRYVLFYNLLLLIQSPGIEFEGFSMPATTPSRTARPNTAIATLTISPRCFFSETHDMHSNGEDSSKAKAPVTRTSSLSLM